MPVTPKPKQKKKNRGKLTPFDDRHQRFLDTYLSNGEKMRPALRAAMGWGDVDPPSKFKIINAYTIIYKHPKVQEAIQALHRKIAVRTEQILEGYMVKKEDVLNELAKIAFSKSTDIMSWKEGEGIKVKDSDKIHPDNIGAITEVIERKDKSVIVKMVDKRQALVDLGKALGLFTEKHEHKHQAVNVNFTIEK